MENRESRHGAAAALEKRTREGGGRYKELAVSSTCPCGGESNEKGIRGPRRANNGKKVARLTGHPSWRRWRRRRKSSNKVARIKRQEKVNEEDAFLRQAAQQQPAPSSHDGDGDTAASSPVGISSKGRGRREGRNHRPNPRPTTSLDCFDCATLSLPPSLPSFPLTGGYKRRVTSDNPI